MCYYPPPRQGGMGYVDGVAMTDRLLGLMALAIGGAIGWFAAGEVAARISHPLLGPAAALGLGLVIGLAGPWWLLRTRRRV